MSFQERIAQSYHQLGFVPLMEPRVMRLPPPQDLLEIHEAVTATYRRLLGQTADEPIVVDAKTV